MTADDLVDRVPNALERAIAANLMPDEPRLVVLKGAFKEALVCTPKRVIIVKQGFMTGQAFGSDAFQLPYPMITSVQVLWHILSGYFEISSGGVQNTPKSYWTGKGPGSATAAPNTIALANKAQAQRFRKACNLILDKVSEFRSPVPTIPVPAALSASDEIAKLWALHQSGALTAAEFETAKAKLLA